MLVLLLAFGAFVTVLGRQVALRLEHESLQRLSHGLARHIVGHWPEVTAAGPAAQTSRDELLRMLMGMNPGVQVYMLDADGGVAQYIGEPPRKCRRVTPRPLPSGGTCLVLALPLGDVVG